MTDRPQTTTPSTNGSAVAPEAVDPDAVETAEWIEALDAVVSHDGPERARDLLTRVIERAQYSGTGPIASLNTPYVNTIPVDQEPPFPADKELEWRLRSVIRWDAMAVGG